MNTGVGSLCLLWGLFPTQGLNPGLPHCRWIPYHLSHSENPMNSMKRQNDRTLKEELPRSVGAHYATGDQWRNSSRKNEGMEPKQKQHPAVGVTGDGSKVRCCKINIAQEPGMLGP